MKMFIDYVLPAALALLLLFAVAVGIALAHDRGVRLDVACHDLRVEPDREPDALVYNSYLGTVVVSWVFPDGARLDETFDVYDLAHEDAADYTIKTMKAPQSYQMVDEEGNEGPVWVDLVGEAKCHDLRQYS